MPIHNSEQMADAARRATERLRAQLDEQMRQHMGGGTFDEKPPMVELNPRPKPAAARDRRVKIVRQNAPARGMNPTIYILVPDQFGNLEPLLDGETGDPYDFVLEYGDPAMWSTNRSAQIEQAAKTAAALCVKLVAQRSPA